MIALFLRDLKLSVRAGGGALIGVLFFLTVVAVVPFGYPTHPATEGRKNRKPLGDVVSEEAFGQPFPSH